MNDVMREVLGKFMLVYLVDIVVFSKTEEKHTMHLDMGLVFFGGG